MIGQEKKYLMQFHATIKGDKAVTKSMQKIKSDMDKTKKSAGGFGQGMKKAIQMAGRSILIIPIWMAMRSAWMMLINAVKEGVTFLKEWEYELAQVRIVGKATEAEINLLSVALLDLSSSLGISHKQLGEGAKLWAQQGRSISEIIPLMDATAKMSMITGRTIGQSVEDMTAIMKSYRIEASNTMSIVDSLTNVMLNHAITADTLASALRVVAPVAKTMGVSFEQLQAIITSTHVITRSKGNKVGMAWRCLDDQTEILTKGGWKHYDEIKIGDFALSLNPKTREMEYKEISDLFIKKDYDGVMYQYDQHMNFKVTPGHNFPVKFTYKKDEFELKKIEEMIEHSHFYIPSSGIWKGNDVEYITIGKTKYPVKQLLTFLGWYISEGNLAVRKDKIHYISIAQSTNSVYYDELKLFLNEMFVSVSPNLGSRSFSIFRSNELGQWLWENCYTVKERKCYNKKVPDFIKELSPRLIKVFLESYYKGDGSVTGGSRKSRRYTTTSWRLVDDISELIVKIEKTPSVYKKRRPENHKIMGRIVKVSPCWEVLEGRTILKSGDSKKVEKVNYQGIIWCPTVAPYHNVYIRRNGKCMFSGQTIFSRMATSAHKAIKEIAQVPVFLTETGEVSEIETVNMRNLGVVLDEVASKWDGLSSAQKMNLAQAMAGKRRLTEFIAYMDNYKEALRAQADALFGAGKAMKATSILSDTLKHRMEGLTQSWNIFVASLATVDVIKGAVGGLSGAFKGMADGIDPLTASYRAFVDTIQPGIVATQTQITQYESLIKAMHELETRNESIIKQNTPERTAQLTKELGQQYIQAMRLAGIDVPIGLQNSIEVAGWLREGLSKTTQELEKLYVKAEKQTLKMEIAGAVDELARLFSAYHAFGVAQKPLIPGLQDMTLEFRDLEAVIKHVRKQVSPEEFKVFAKSILKYFELVKAYGETDVRVAEASLKVREMVTKQEEKRKVGLEAEAQTRQKLLEIELKGIRAGKSKLNIEQMKLAHLTKEGVSRDDNIQKERDSLKISIAKGKAQIDSNVIREKEAGILERMRALGASRLQVEIQILANMEARGVLTEERRRQEEKIAQVMQIQVLSTAKKLVDHEVELLRIRGLVGSQLLTAKMAIEDAVLGRASETTELQRQLDMEKAITREKQNQIEYSEESKKLYQIALKYGKDIAKAHAEVLRGKTDVEDLGMFEEEDVFKKTFPKFMERKTLREFFEDEGKGISIKERFEREEITKATQQIAQRQKQTEAFKFGVGNFDGAVNRFGIAIDKFATLIIPKLGVDVGIPSEEGKEDISHLSEYEKYKRGLPYEETKPFGRRGIGTIEEADKLGIDKVTNNITAPVNIPVEVRIEGITSEQAAIETLEVIIKEVKKKQSELSREFNNKIEYFT